MISLDERSRRVQAILDAMPVVVGPKCMLKPSDKAVIVNPDGRHSMIDAAAVRGKTDPSNTGGQDVGQQEHYTACAIQPIDFIVKNGLDFLEGNVIKYVARYKRKNGIEDLRKARQYLDWLIERELNA